MIDRLIRVITLNRPVYGEIEKDNNATMEAAIVVALTAIAGAIGALLASVITPAIETVSPGFGVRSAISLIISAFVGWVVWAYVAYFVGKSLFKADVTPVELLRTLGYASAPRLLSILSFIPCLGGLASLIGAILSLVTGYFAAKEALDLDTTNTIITIVISWVVVFIVSFIIAVILGVGSAVVGSVAPVTP